MQAVTTLDCSRIAQDLQIRKVQVEAVVQLLDEGNTVPFITRYRKERTGGLNEEVIRQIQARTNFLRQLADRKQTILKSIEGQGKLTEELRKSILGADTTRKLEDLYLPYKPKKRSLANAAREKGLEPLALAIWYSDSAASINLEELIPGLVNPEKSLNSTEDVLLGTQHILSEMIAETAEVRATARHLLWETGEIQATKNEKAAEAQGLEYKGYFQFKEAARQIPPHRILALNRGEKEGILKVKLEWAADRVKQAALHALAEHLIKVAGKMPALPTPPPPASEPATVPSAEVSVDHIPHVETPAEQPAVPELAIASEPQPIESPQVSEPSPIAQEISVLHAEAPAPVLDSQPLVAQMPTEAQAVQLIGEQLVADSEFRSPHVAFLLHVFDDALSRLLLPSLEREIRHELTDEAESHAVAVFARNLKSLLLQPPLRGKRVLAVDPGFRTGCKIAILDEFGGLVEHTVIYPFGGGGKKGKKGAEAEKKEAEPHAEVSAAEPSESQAQVPAEAEKPVETSETQAALASPSVSTEAPATVETPPPAPEAPESVVETPVELSEAKVTEVEPSTSSDATAPVVPPQSQPAQDRRLDVLERLKQLIVQHHIEVVALGNGTGCRETEELVAELIASAIPDLAYVIVNEAGASVYSVSQVAREEFPEYDATTRSAISIGRRLQDPLSELVKIDPQSIGVGLYQHDVGRKELRETLESIVESCVNQVGVDVNTASVPLLRYVSGMNQLVAREVVEYRKQHGAITTREQLLQVQGMGPARYLQAAGFLKLPNSSNPFDKTWIHPESYPVAEKLITELGYTPAVIEDKANLEEFHIKLRALPVEELARNLGAGLPTVQDIVQSLLKPGRDPREDLPPPIFKKGILKIDDLQVGMELKGTVLNVVDFGAFVDVGLKDSGLVHISQMANRYIKSPYDVVAVNDVVTVWVLSVDKERHHVSLTMIKPGTERKPEKRPQQPRQSRPPRGRRPAASGQDQPVGAPTTEGATTALASPPESTGDRRGGNRPPRGRGPGQGHAGQGHPGQGQVGHGGSQGQGQGRGPGRGSGQGQGRGPGHGQGQGRGQGGRRPPQHAGGEGAPSGQQATPPLPPRKPRREPPRPKLTQDAIEGKVPLRTFGELNALFQAKKTPNEPPVAPPAAPPAPELKTEMPVEAPPVEPTQESSASSS